MFLYFFMDIILMRKKKSYVLIIQSINKILKELNEVGSNRMILLFLL